MKNDLRVLTGHSAEVAHLFWEQKVAGSIPAAPIGIYYPNQ
jgi:hypothetical protein